MEPIKLHKPIAAADMPQLFLNLEPPLQTRIAYTLTHDRKNDVFELRRSRRGEEGYETLLTFSDKDKNGNFHTVKANISKEEFMAIAKAAYESDPKLYSQIVNSFKGTVLEIADQSKLLNIETEARKIEKDTDKSEFKRMGKDFDRIAKKYKDLTASLTDENEELSIEKLTVFLNQKNPDSKKNDEIIKKLAAEFKEFYETHPNLAVQTFDKYLENRGSGIAKDESDLLDKMSGKDFRNLILTDKQFAKDALDLMANISKTDSQMNEPSVKASIAGLEKRFKDKSGTDIQLH